MMKFSNYIDCFVGVPPRNDNKRGFTFIELIVVVTIIAVLMAIAAVTYSSTTIKSRDAKRLSDIEKIRSALEICRSEDGRYPPAANVPEAVSNNLLCNSGTNVLSRFPTGPKGDTYVYTPAAVSPFTTYTLEVTLENNVNCPYDTTGGNCVARQP